MPENRKQEDSLMVVIMSNDLSLIDDWSIQRRPGTMVAKSKYALRRHVPMWTTRKNKCEILSRFFHLQNLPSDTDYPVIAIAKTVAVTTAPDSH